MSLETDRNPTSDHGLLDAFRSSGRVLRRYLIVAGARAGEALHTVGQAASRIPPVRWIGSRLIYRIFAANIVGLLIIIGGVLYLSEYQTSLINAKRELLRVQGEIIAAAIANDGKLDTRRLSMGADGAAIDEQVRSFDESFAAAELSIQPERVTPILRRLIQPTRTRARIYSKDGTLVVDSASLLQRGQLMRHEPRVPAGEKPSTKNFWTRLKYWMIDKELPVYKEIGNANGQALPEVRNALDGTTNDLLLLNEKGEQIVSSAVPIKRGGNVRGVLLLSTQPGDIDRILEDERELILTLAAIALVSTLVTSLLLARTVAGPMRRLSEAADSVTRHVGPPAALAEYSGRSDEVGQMATAFGTMTNALYRRIESSERFAADVAHELKNPLTAARSVAEALFYAKSEKQRDELVEQIKNELSRLNRLITDVSNASRLDAELARQQMKPVDTTRVAVSVAQIFRDILSSDSRRVLTIVDPAGFEGAFTVSGDAGRLGQVITNLVDNAISFSPEGKTVTIRVRRTDDNKVEVIVDDEGPGIPEDRLNIIFDRFYTDRPQTESQRGKNSGLGLSISREIVRAHGGEIRASNRPPPSAGAQQRGARFTLTLPALVAAGRGGHHDRRRA